MFNEVADIAQFALMNSRTFKHLSCFKGLSRPWIYDKKFKYFQGLSRMRGNPGTNSSLSLWLIVIAYCKMCKRWHENLVTHEPPLALVMPPVATCWQNLFEFQSHQHKPRHTSYVLSDEHWTTVKQGSLTYHQLPADCVMESCPVSRLTNEVLRHSGGWETWKWSTSKIK